MPNAPRETTYDVRVWKTQVYEGERGNTYRVRWIVDGRPRGETFSTAALAESYRASLVASARRGEAFDAAKGLPISAIRDDRHSLTWYDFACKYVDMKWPAISNKYRQGIAEALTTITVALIRPGPAAPDPLVLRSALTNWAFTSRRNSDACPRQVSEALTYARGNCRPVTDLSQAIVLREVLNATATRLDGKPSAGRTVHYKRVVLSSALNYAVELDYLSVNPIASLKSKAPKTAQQIDRRVVVNPKQATALLDEVRVTKNSGRELYAFFACLYYSGLRPEEAVNLRVRNLQLPETGFGWITLERATPETERHWSDSGERRSERALKHRATGETRRVPCPPALVVILREHLAEFGADKEGRLFRGKRSGRPLASATYVVFWARVREAALTPEQFASPLAKRPYDLRHACVSTWLSGGVAATQVAEWAGHSVAVLHSIYAKCLDGQEALALDRITDALAQGREVAVKTDEVAERPSGARIARREGLDL